MPLKELAGIENGLSIVFRVTPGRHPDEPVYFTQHLRVPPLEEDAKGDAYLQGAFDVGEGSYHVDWLMRDRIERVCSSSWDSEAVLGSKDRPMSLAIAPDAIQRADGEEFKEEPPVERASLDPPLNVKVLRQFRPSEFAVGRAPAARYHRPGVHLEDHIARPAHREILDSRL